MNTYLISFTSQNYPVIERHVILEFLDSQPIVKNWFAVMPNSIIIATEGSIAEITKILTKQFPQNLTYIVTNASKADGLANKQVWDFINDPKSSGRWI